MFTLACVFIFGLLAIKGDRYVFGLLAILAFTLWLNSQAFDYHDSTTYYYNRAFLTFITGILIARKNTLLGYYQSIILLFTLIAYGVLAYDVQIGTNYIYDNYEAIVYGLVVCHIIGAFAGIRPSISNSYPSSFISIRNNQGAEK